MNREKFNIVADRIDKIEKTIFKLQELSSFYSFTIIGNETLLSPQGDITTVPKLIVELPDTEMSTEIFSDNILEYYINILNLELIDLRNEFETL